ncbi:Phytochrome-like protein cph1 [Actinomadura rubteroloni]|uniref:histidine kinase n=1 Tax=Actinomadura rubteroloni TaxID=1926885 RepID=A0A2P4ULK7_9ACTN|nr:ATP-binding protein [Actinomadura rubteroloni]POM25938.1 Phytochrome-like protein cph1 [Actinomadura rubteroloni]
MTTDASQDLTEDITDEELAELEAVLGPPAFMEPMPRAERRGLDRIRLGQLYRLGTLLLAVLLAAAVALAGFALAGNIGARNTLIDKVDPATLEQFQLSGAIARQDTLIRDYAATGAAASLAGYRAAVRDEAAAAHRMRTLLRGVHGAGPTFTGLDRVTAESAAWRAAYADAVAADRRGADGLEKTGQARFVSVRADIARVQQRITALHAETVRILQSRANTATWSVGGALAVIVITGLVLAVLIRRTVLRPVSQLSEKVQAVVQGDLTHPLDVRRPVEISELAAVIDAMRHRILLEWQRTARARQLLDAQAAELRRSNAELEQFAYVASHDLQEPLRKVASFCQMIERRYGDQLDDRGRQYIEFAVDGAKRMQALINDLLGFSRVGRVSRTEDAVDLGAVAAQSLADLATLREETGADVRVADLPHVRGDRTQLGQLFQNLIGNAIKFRRPGVAPEVEISVRRDGDTWEFACADNGIGVEPRHADRIFLIFQRLHPREEYAGTGIGLALCKKIVEYHGGRIWLDANEDQENPGTVIRWTLPAEKETEDE